MLINRLTINHLRNINELVIEPSHRFNVFFGENGSGKTSILEAVHYLSLGKSFRSHLNRHIIQDKQEQLTLAAKLDGDIPVGIEKNRSGETRIRINSEPVRTIAELTDLMPVLLLNTDSYQLLGAPEFRRKFMDWGVFHVKHSFLKSWRQYQQCLKQRNASLRMKEPRARIIAWDHTLASFATELDLSRAEYFNSFYNVFQKIMPSLLGSDVKLKYCRGWDLEIPLIQVLQQNIESDCRAGYTLSGPHRADFKIIADGNPAAHYLSRGQQKRLLFALMLAQGRLLRDVEDKGCIYLMDDLAAELDDSGQQQIADILSEQSSQVYITCLDKKALNYFKSEGTRMFHVKHGACEAS